MSVWGKYVVGPLASRFGAPCRESSRLLSESMDHTLPWNRWVKLRLHLAVCDVCSRYGRQLLFVRKLIQHFPEVDHDHGGDPTVTLSEEARARLKEKLKRPQTMFSLHRQYGKQDFLGHGTASFDEMWPQGYTRKTVTQASAKGTPPFGRGGEFARGGALSVRHD